MKEEERTTRRSWNTTDALENVEEMIQTGVQPAETAYEVDDIISEFADASALTPERTGRHIERMEQRLQKEASPEAPLSQQEAEESAAPVETADPEETARFVQAQVSAAMEEQERTEARQRFWDRFKRRKPAEQQPDEGAEPTVDADELSDAPEEWEDNVVSLPEDPLFPMKQFVRGIRDQAVNFADNMYADDRSERPSWVEEEAAPGTDEEEVPPRPVRPKREKQKATEQDLPASVLAERYHSGLSGLGQRTVIVLVLAVVLLLLGAAAELSWPILGVLAERRRVLSALLTWGLALCAVLGLDVLWLGLSAPVRGRTGLHTMMAAAVLVTLVDGVVYALPGRDGPLPLAGVAALSLGCAMWGAYDRKRALYISCRTVSGAAEPYRVTLDENKWDGNPAFDKEAGSTKGFGSQIQGMDGSIAISRFVVPVLLLLAVATAVTSIVVSGNVGLLSWCLSVILIAGAPLGSLLCYGQPLLRVTKRLDRYGAVLAGWDGAASMTGKAGILIKDSDLFPVGCVSISDSRYFGSVSEEQVVSCCASILKKAGCSLSKPFEDQLKLQGGFLRPVEELEWHESGALSAMVRGHKVVLARISYLNALHFPVPEGARVRFAMYCIIDGELQGMFKLRYTVSHYIVPALQGLLRAGVELVLATRDFNINPGMLETLKEEGSQAEGTIPTRDMEYPITSRRKELSEPGQPHNKVLGALLLREGLGAYSDAIIGGRRLCDVTRVNTVLTLVSSLLGILLTAFLTSQLAFASLTVENIVVFLLLWLVPDLLITGFADKF